MTEEKKYSYWINSAFYSMLQRLTVMVFGIASFMVLSRTLTQGQRGVWDLFLMITANIELFRQALVRNAYVKYLNSSPDAEIQYIRSAALALNTVITLVIILALGIFTVPFCEFLHAPELIPVLYIFIVGIFVLIPFSHFEWTQSAYTDFRGIFWAYMIRQSSWFIMMIVHLLVFGNITLTQLSMYYTLGIVVGTIASFQFVKKYLSKGFIISLAWIKNLWNFGRIIFGSSLSTFLFRNADQLLIPRMLNTAVLAVYTTSLRIINILDLPSLVISEIMFPKSSRVAAFGSESQLKYLYEKSVGSVLSLLLPACAIILIFPQLFIIILAGKQYLGAVVILRVMLINSLFSAFLKQFATVMDSSGRARINFRLISAMAVVCTILCWIFLKTLHNPIGAAYSLILTHAFGFCISQYFLHKYFKVNFLNTFKYALAFYPEMIRIIKDKTQSTWRTIF